MKIELRQYQKEGVIFAKDVLKNKYRGVYIADEMGLGKSAQALHLIHEIAKPNDNFIVISPAFLVPKWEQEILKHLPKHRKYTILITSYSALSNPDTLAYYTSIKYKAAVYDEGHYIKNHDSIRTMAILGGPGLLHTTIDQRSKFTVWVSGTPMPNRVGEIYLFLKSIKHPILKNQTYEEFVIKWSVKYKISKLVGISHKGIKNAKKLRKALSDCMIRRLKYDVLTELPPSFRDYIPVPITKAMEKLEVKFEKFSDKKLSIWEDPNVIEHYLKTVPGFTKFAEFRKKQSLYKVGFVLDYLTEYILPAKKKFIIFTYHQETAEEYYEKLKVKHKILITGKVPVRKRLEIVNGANLMKECVLICSMNSVKEGLDMIGFDTGYWTEIDWSFGLLDQTEGRLPRLGQKNKCFFYYFIFPKGMEQKMFKTYQDKKETVEQILPVTKSSPIKKKKRRIV